MWLATRNTNMDFYHTTLSRLSSHKHTHWTTPQSALHTTTGLVDYYLYALHTITGLYTELTAAKNPSDSTDAGEGEGGQKKAATNALLEIDSRRQQYTSNMLYALENTVINYYSILIIIVGRKLIINNKNKTTLS